MHSVTIKTPNTFLLCRWPLGAREIHFERRVSMAKQAFPLWLMACLMAFVAACDGNQALSPPSNAESGIKGVPDSAWQKLSEKKIYFGHKSVGQNIVDGVQDVLRQFPRLKMNILESNKPEDFSSPVFAHSAVGSNSDPESKMKAFEEIMDGGVGNKADIAFFKFCWIDILPQTNSEKVFTDYQSFMTRMKEKYPKTTFIHVTVPLTSNESGMKALFKKGKDLIKKLIGRANVYDNVKRNELNEMLRRRYEGKEPFFDLARIEAYAPDGKEGAARKGGRKEEQLISIFTDDGGHLNSLGRRIVAERLLVLLAELSEKPL